MILPSSVWMSSLPCCGMMSMSPSVEQYALRPIPALAAYTWIASPSFWLGSPLPPTVLVPCTKSTWASSAGSRNGSHASCAGKNDTAGFRGENDASVSGFRGRGRTVRCATEGRTRYIHTCWISRRRVAKAEPLSCSE